MQLLKFNDAIIDFKNAYKYNNNYYKAIINISKCYLQIFQPKNSVSELENVNINKNNQIFEEYTKEVFIFKYIYVNL